MDTYLTFKKRYAFLQRDFQNTLNVLKSNLANKDDDWKPSKQLLDNMELLSHYLSIVSSKLIDIEECVIDDKKSKTTDDLELLENYRKNSEIIEKMKPLMFLLKLQENN
tara:strand:+ start:358 stop:684 length:327 start_codon:yes stop_codon:yes gene_type:complete